MTSVLDPNHVFIMKCICITVAQNIPRVVYMILSIVNSNYTFFHFYFMFLLMIASFMPVRGVYKQNSSLILFGFIVNMFIYLVILGGLIVFTVLQVFSSDFQNNIDFKKYLRHYLFLYITEFGFCTIMALVYSVPLDDSKKNSERWEILRVNKKREKRFIASLAGQLNESLFKQFEKQEKRRICCLSHNHFLICLIIGNIVFYAFTCALAILNRSYIIAIVLFIVNGIDISTFNLVQKRVSKWMSFCCFYNLFYLVIPAVLIFVVNYEHILINDEMPQYMHYIFVFALAVFYFQRFIGSYVMLKLSDEHSRKEQKKH